MSNARIKENKMRDRGERKPAGNRRRNDEDIEMDRISTGKGEHSYRSSNKKDHRAKRSSNSRTASSQPKDDKVITKEDSGYVNNPDWYMIDPVVAKQSTDFSFAQFLGEKVELDQGGAFNSNLTSDKFDVGTICTIELNPSVGSVGTGLDAKLASVNQQGYKMYSRLSSVNSKNTQYMPNDVTTMLLAMGELIKMIGWGERALGLAWGYNVRNRTMPKRLIMASGFDPEDLFSHLAQYRIEFNTKIIQANKIPFPSNINYFKKCSELYSNVFKDEVDDMSQLYVFKPHTTWKLDETGEQGTKLITHAFAPYDASTGAWKFSDYLSLLDSMITDMMLSATFNYVYADIVNYANSPRGNTGTALLNFQIVPDGYAIIPIYNPMMLTMIHNLTIMGIPEGTGADIVLDKHTIHTTNSNDIIPNVTNATLEYAPVWIDTNGNNTYAKPFAKVLDYHVDCPDDMMRIESTRLVSGTLHVDKESATPTSSVAYDLVCGDNYVVQLLVWASNNVNPQVVRTSNVWTTALIELWSHFKEAPMLYDIVSVYNSTTHVYDVALNGILAEIDFFTTIDMYTLNRINVLCMYGLFEPRDFDYGNGTHK